MVQLQVEIEPMPETVLVHPLDDLGTVAGVLAELRDVLC